MAKEKTNYVELNEFYELAAEIMEKYPDRCGGFDVSQMVVYAIDNKNRPPTKREWYKLTCGKASETFTNTKKVFVELYMSDWDMLDEVHRQWLVYQVLRRVEVDEGNLKAAKYDYNDTLELVRTLGPEWIEKEELPNLLKDQIEFK